MVKILSRDSINRMVGRKSSVAGVGGGGGDVDLSGYATKIWTQETFVSIDFFRSLFRAYDSQNHEILPNDTTSTIDNIKAMFGFWTDFYVSALGTGGQSSLGIRLAQLADVNVAGVTNGQVLTYDTTSGKWIASTPQSGTDMATVWANLAAADNTKQIDVSHLTTALTGYATKTWVGQQGYQTQTTADGRYLKLSGGTISGNPGTLTVNNTTNGWGIHGYSVYNNEFSSAFLTYAGYGAWFGVSTNDSSHYILNVRKNISRDGSGGDAVIYARSDGNVGIGTDSPAYPLDVNGYSRDIVTLFKNYNDNGNAGFVGRGSGSVNTIMLVAYSGNAVGIGAANQLDLYIDTSHNVGIGTTSPSHKLHVNGGIYSTSYVTALSDARHKNVIGDTGLTVEQIAEAPAIRFQWNDRDDQSVFAGSIAQYWQKVLPEVVQSQADDTLSLDYQVAALISSITVARKVVDHERRIAELERENKELKLKLKIA